LKWHFYEIFAFLNTTFEIRVATVLGLGAVGLTVAGLACLLGYHLKEPEEYTVKKLEKGQFAQLELAVPRPSMPKRRETEPGPARPPSPGKARKQPPVQERSGICFSNIISHFQKQTGGKEEAINAARFLEKHDFSAGVFPLGNYYVLTVGEWHSKKEADRVRQELNNKLQMYDIPRVRSENIQDSYSFQFQKSKRVYP
jgi:hypothetical protein